MTVTSVLHHCETVGSAERQRMALAQTAERSSRSTCTIRSGTTISATAAIWPDAVVLRAGAVVAAACVALQQQCRLAATAATAAFAALETVLQWPAHNSSGGDSAKRSAVVFVAAPSSVNASLLSTL
eukprot:13249-Heterococcus_DN1.PRE.2